MKKIFILLVITIMMTGCKSTINTYDTNMVCKYTYNEELDGEVIESQSIIYLDYDSNNYVTKAIYQSIADVTNYDESLIESLDYVIDMYNGMEGISSRRYNVDKKVVLEITYDYKKINIDSFRKELGDLLNEDSLLGSVDKLPVKLSEFEEIELKDYNCKINK